MKKLYALLLTAAVTLSLAACGAAQTEASTVVSSVETADSGVVQPDETPATRTVTDVWQREVEVPGEVDSIVCLGSMGPRFAAYLDVVDKMVGAEDHDKEGFNVLRDYNAACYDEIKDLPAVGAGGGSGQNNGYAEQIIELAPDVILAGFDAEAADELQRQTGIPVVSVRYRDNGFIDENFTNAMRVFAETVGAQERCEEVLAFVDECKADLAARTAGVPEEEKPAVYTGAVTFNGRHGFAGTYVNFGPFIAVGARNVADAYAEEQVGEDAQAAAESGVAYLGSNGFDVDLEQVIAWDPDVIFLDPGNMDLVNDEYKTNPGYFDALRAVQEGQVYTMPSFNNCGQNVTYALIDAYYAGVVLYPEQFADVDIAEKAGEILSFMVGKDIFADMEAGGLYYGTITIGE